MVNKCDLSILIGAKISSIVKINDHYGIRHQWYFEDIPNFVKKGKTLRLEISDNEGYGADFDIEEIDLK